MCRSGSYVEPKITNGEKIIFNAGLSRQVELRNLTYDHISSFQEAQRRGNPQIIFDCAGVLAEHGI